MTEWCGDEGGQLIRLVNVRGPAGKCQPTGNTEKKFGRVGRPTGRGWEATGLRKIRHNGLPSIRPIVFPWPQRGRCDEKFGIVGNEISSPLSRIFLVLL